MLDQLAKGALFDCLDLFRLDLGVCRATADGAFVLIYSDTTGAFDPTSSRPAWIERETADAGGRGLRLMRELSSNRAYNHDGGVNRLKLCFAVT